MEKIKKQPKKKKKKTSKSVEEEIKEKLDTFRRKWKEAVLKWGVLRGQGCTNGGRSGKEKKNKCIVRTRIHIGIGSSNVFKTRLSRFHAFTLHSKFAHLGQISSS